MRSKKYQHKPFVLKSSTNVWLQHRVLTCDFCDIASNSDKKYRILRSESQNRRMLKYRSGNVWDARLCYIMIW